MQDNALTYRRLGSEDIPTASTLVARVFDQFVAPEYAPEGVQEFYRYIQPTAFQARFQTQYFSLVALVQDKIEARLVGLIEMRGRDHISLLFVDPEFQRQGIARELVRQALQLCRASDPGLAEVSVNSSSYAAPVYEKLGFSRVGERQVRHGIGFIPMRLNLSNLS